ncbi:MBOAT family protein [Fulvivirgaceae bacterium PWU5]|uniref:MBOAT family protein n=1 Tax=Dawidia cretensis TaxID=2782350 RepID=A0AAP2E0S4_9BACT|nr:MBOAT family O-acyltransferase [Dawidia cretensis]MBT1709577.1 MBOAT family protein [Dawidia cretensis]
MLFNSLEFAVFLLVVYALYWVLRERRLQNNLLWIVSYVFYAWWDWRFLFLLMLSTLIDYSFGLWIHNSQNRKKLFLWLSIFNNLAVLFFFKYFNFFSDSARILLDTFGFHMNPVLLEVLLPVGISFYTFHGMSYVIDIYRGQATPIKSFVDYSLFVSFFPLLVAGPIERATHLLPQITRDRSFNYNQSVDGLRLILWGLFKKVVIADNCALVVNEVFNHYGTATGSELIIGTVFFAFQIYGDFSGYSDIAIGTAKLFGIELLVNFRTPYFARDIAEFWRRWHISLTTWFRDYIYIPLGGSKVSRMKAVRNTMIVFLVSGFWHGANWTFIVWGALNGLYFLPLLLTGNNRRNTDTIAAGRLLPSPRELFQVMTTFALTCFAWIFFRSADMTQAVGYIQGIFTHPFWGLHVTRIDTRLVGILGLFVVLEWLFRNGLPEFLQRMNAVTRFALYYGLVLLVILFGAFGSEEFIYFQF